MQPEGDNDSRVLDRQNGGLRILRASANIADRCPSIPLGNRLRVDPVTLGQPLPAVLTMLGCGFGDGAPT